jgi:ribosome-binding ATPase YchF (GTP1/OBG family)
VHAWAVPKGTDIVTCAGRIHTDLARGFIRAEIAHFDGIMASHNFNDAKTKGLVTVVGKEYTIQPGDVIEVLFNV